MNIHVANLTTWVVVLSFAGYYLVAGVSGLLDVPNTILSISMRACVGALSAAVVLHSMTHLHQPPKLALWLLVILFLYGTRLFSQTIFDPCVLKQEGSIYWIWFIGTVIVPIIAVMTTKNLDGAKVQRLLIVMFGLAAIITAANGSTTTFLEEEVYDTGRAALASLNPISVGNLGASLSLICLWAIFGAKKSSNIFKSFYFFGVILGLYLIFVASSRGPVFSIAAALGVMGLGLPPKKKKWFLFGSSVIIATTLYYLLNNVSAEDFHFVIRLFSLFSDFESDGSNMERIGIYSTSLQQIFESPFLGSSIENTANRWDPHNLYLELFLATGFIGGLIPIIILPLLVLRSIRLVKMGHSSSGIALLYVYNFVGAQMSGNVYTNGGLWVSAMLVAVSQYPRSEKYKSNQLPTQDRRFPPSFN